MENKLIWHTEMYKISEIVPNTKNPRVMSKKQMEDLKNSLRKFNLVETPVLDIDKKVIVGHQRLVALKLIGRENEEIECRVPNRKLSKEEYNQYLLSSNRIHGDWDWSLLEENFDVETLKISGFDEIDISKIFENNLELENDEWDEESEIKKIKIPNTKLGDIISLGEHKLICGDANDPEVIKKLFGDKKASMIYQDPVYNIALSYSSGLGGKQNYGGNVNDKRTDEEYKEFLRKSLVNALSVSKPDVHVFYWNTEQHIWIVQTLYRELGIDNKRVCLWVKNGQNPTPQVAFSKCYEPCIYGTRGKPYLSKKEQGLNEIFNKEVTSGNNLIEEVSSIWAVKRLNPKEYTHATSKPADLHEKAIRRCTLPGDIILDSFLGSGSTLIACEQLKRVCYGVELEPVYCDLIIRRYEKFTGKKAIITSYEKNEETIIS